jgi:hypothetical protein
MSLAQDANSRSALTVLVRGEQLTVPLPGSVRIDHLARTGRKACHGNTCMLQMQCSANANGG